MSDFKYRCQSPSDVSCAETCTSLEACKSCDCAVLSLEAGGDWGEVMDVVFCILPIVFLIVVTIKPNPMPTTLSLPLSAFLMFLVRLMYLGSDPLLVCASAVLGLFEALTPLSIMAGAITLFESMEATYCLPYMMREMKALTAGHPIAELMLIFCFAYMVEGASGFGTPVALAAPMLVSTGHPAFESVVVLLIMNTFATVWGAVGTPIWFGFGALGLTDDDFLSISKKAAIALATGAFILMPFVLNILVPMKIVKENIMFVYASLLTCVGPAVGIAFVSYEFPSLLGGMIGCAGTALLISYKVGLKEFNSDELGRDHLDIGSVSDNSIVRKFHKSASNVSNITDGDENKETTADINGKDNTSGDSSQSPPEENPKEFQTMPSLRDTVDDHLGPRKEMGLGYVKEMIMRTFPIWAVVLLLILTRVEQIGIKEHLVDQEPNFSIHFGTFGTFRMSSTLVVQLRNILTFPSMNWKYELLYVPFLVPFVFVSALTMLLYRKDLAHSPKDIFVTVTSRLLNPAIALLGALVLVQLMIRVDTEAPANILGTILADWFKQGFIVISPLLGALGSFFSGSTTVSDLTFGEIQRIAAESIGTSQTTMLALQAVGGSAGNGVCLNNIIAACAVVGLQVGEGKILARTFKFVFANTTIATVVMLALFFRF